MSRRALLGGALAVICGAGAYYGVRRFAHPTVPRVGITTTLGEGEPFGGAAFLAHDDLVSDRQWQERAESFKAFLALGPVLLDRADGAQSQAYLDKTIADPGRKQALQDGVRNGKIAMAAIGFFDDCAEDDDVITLRSGTLDVTVPLTHRVQYVLVPIPQGGTAEVAVTGLRDGGGGHITVGMVTPAGVIHLPRIDPGDQLVFTAR